MVDAMHGKRIQMNCSIDDIRYLESKALACREVYTRHRSIRFRNCHGTLQTNTKTRDIRTVGRQNTTTPIQLVVQELKI